MRYYLVVIDSFGIGADSVCGEYGDCSSNTALSASRAIEGEKWRFLVRMGLGNSCKTLGVELEGCEEVDNPIANYAVLEKRRRQGYPDRTLGACRHEPRFHIDHISARISIIS